jgi:hypothetical protein
MRLTRGFTYLAAVSLAAGTAFAVTVPHAVAASDKDSLKPASTAIKGSAPNFVSSGTIGGLAFTASCTSSTLSAKTPARGLGPVSVKPTFTGCTDNFGGTDKVKVHGVWKLTFADAANDEAQTEPNSGDGLTLLVPKGGATFTSTFLPGCTITVAPTAPFSFTSAYNDVSVATVNVNLPVSGSSGCPPPVGATAATTATYTITPGVTDQS